MQQSDRTRVDTRGVTDDLTVDDQVEARGHLEPGVQALPGVGHLDRAGRAGRGGRGREVPRPEPNPAVVPVVGHLRRRVGAVGDVVVVPGPDRDPAAVDRSGARRWRAPRAAPSTASSSRPRQRRREPSGGDRDARRDGFRERRRCVTVSQAGRLHPVVERVGARACALRDVPLEHAPWSGSTLGPRSGPDGTRRAVHRGPAERRPPGPRPRPAASARVEVQPAASAFPRRGEGLLQRGLGRREPGRRSPRGPAPPPTAGSSASVSPARPRASSHSATSSRRCARDQRSSRSA